MKPDILQCRVGLRVRRLVVPRGVLGVATVSRAHHSGQFIKELLSAHQGYTMQRSARSSANPSFRRESSGCCIRLLETAGPSQRRILQDPPRGSRRYPSRESWPPHLLPSSSCCFVYALLYLSIIADYNTNVNTSPGYIKTR